MPWKGGCGSERGSPAPRDAGAHRGAQGRSAEPLPQAPLWGHVSLDGSGSRCGCRRSRAPHRPCGPGRFCLILTRRGSLAALGFPVMGATRAQGPGPVPCSSASGSFPHSSGGGRRLSSFISSSPFQYLKLLSRCCIKSGRSTKASQASNMSVMK